ncbi:hypothetical protein [Nocardioides sp. P5_C9_2]
MSDDSTQGDGSESIQPESAQSDSTQPEWVRRRRLAAVFGDVLPEQTADDRPSPTDSSGLGDEWYRDQVPPHHG